MFLQDPRKNWWAAAVFTFFFGIDFYTDVWYRSAELLWTTPSAGIAASAMTLAIYTFGSEMFISAGFGMTIYLLVPTIKQFKILAAEFRSISNRVDHYQKQPKNQQKP